MVSEKAASSSKRRPPTTGAALVARTKVKNRMLALAVIGFMAAVFILTIVVTVTSHRNTSAEHGDTTALAAPPRLPAQ